MTDDDKIDVKDFLKKVNKEGLKKVLFPDYKFNLWIFRAALFLSLALAVYCGFLAHWSFEPQIYVHCPLDSPGPCPNPFSYSNLMGVECPKAPLCLKEQFYPGEDYGVPPNPLLQNYGWIILVIFGFAFVVNHYMMNKPPNQAIKEKGDA